MSAELFTFFWHGPFSQWQYSEFTVAGTKYTHAEQFMMHSKALVFNDHEVAKKILQTTTPKEQKALGRTVKNFDARQWGQFSEGVVYTGSYAKFTQNPELLEHLLATEGTTLVEASPLDKIWGIGLGADNPKAQDRSQWRGLNLLGEILTRVREALLFEIKRGTRTK